MKKKEEKRIINYPDTGLYTLVQNNLIIAIYLKKKSQKLFTL